MRKSEEFSKTIDLILTDTVKLGLSSGTGVIISFMPVWYHQIVVAEYSKIIARAIGFSDRVIKRLFTAGLFHDISKITWNSNLHTKPYRFLSEGEKDKIRLHPRESADILMKYAGKHKKTLTAGSVSIIDMVTYHHEKPDGTGYYSVKDIPKEIALLSIADIFDACTENRPYRARPMTSEEAAKFSTDIFSSLFSEDESLMIRRKLINAIYQKNVYRGLFDAEFAV